ncbi:membrane protein insertase YidC [Pseudoxanthomonas winnipegensis]|uniref:Membrane protein insertase YidC n=1 Tax=Pseudoxanthomonas winnipegensis TaxID=2480810 RepID=A0A4Q9TDF3_9GAMM|nr:membrane protein insertase YidC [Pseudoxanthomonas winnipegensis]RZZ88488.1 membrane protein insertase YidC [Pseudoxanthomonas winnipegensis]TAA34775.1 membrane protein insertase YidC [Pseudoxanthomonas winnipegensis]TBV72869.1 membrane protein insertase YidC [Pseudoxanthomonas winnipegensis]
MNQTRVFLIFAWLMVATLLWMEWGKWKTAQDHPATPVAAATTTPAADAGGSGVPSTEGLATTPSPGTAASTTAPANSAAAAPAAASTQVTVTTDTLKLVIDGSKVLRAQLLQYPQSRDPGAPPVELFNQNPAQLYTAGLAWTSQGSAAPGPGAVFRPEQPQRDYMLASGQDSLRIPFVWEGNGVRIVRTFTITRGSYLVGVSDQVTNTGSAPWTAVIYRQLERTPPPPVKGGITNPHAFSLVGAAWRTASGAYERRKFGDDYLEDGKLNQDMKGGWIAMLEHHFLSAWVPDPQQPALVSLDERTVGGVRRYLVSETGPSLTVAPGQTGTTDARLWVGPKLVKAIKASGIPGLDSAVDYSRFAPLAVIGSGLFWILSHLHDLLGNWGWSIIGLVVVVKLVLFPLSSAQYKSMAKMRKFQPRMQQLKERYGEDRAKLQQAMMELYKKEKINPMGGCLPILVQMPIFLCLYWVLNESVELRQAPWILWIHDLTARDPYFILPVLNVLVMWLTQKLSPTTGMDPTQAKMMQFMPLIFGATMAFFPSGLVLYWVTNGSLGLLQQWWMGRVHGQPSLGKPESDKPDKTVRK